ncbi:Hypothetical predicted protein [Cloeon dipterum]|uniref:Carboxylic ester hydrolase n=1 Tax=Cloeon dipterum TaxID=197152 RepID=A0A8S1CZT0_9INSE|nr:Hypothetical predicted protein [Cloeon dipterum]
MMRSVCILVLCAAASAVAEQVNITGLGVVEGITSHTAWNHRTIYEYKGIQYAQSPSGERRFKPPVKTEAWDDVYNATQFGQVCPQPQESNSVFNYERAEGKAAYQQSRSKALAADPEDCLTLNVYTPTTDKNAMLPVLVYIHGGFFLMGSPANYNPSYLLEHDVILVTIQYRLGPLGFLFLDDAEAPGNVALMDQIMALEWVRDHIAEFGGNPAKVTLGGLSAGAGSASLLMFSEKANDLFSQVMLQSGSALGLWVIDDRVGVQDSLTVAKFAGCDDSLPVADVAQCLREKTPEVIINAYLQHSAEQRKSGHLGTGGSMPVIQSADKGYETVITESPRRTLANGNYQPRPMLIGVNKHEGLYVLDYVYQAYLLANNLVGNTDFLKNDFVTVLLNAIYVRENSQTFVDAVTRRYLSPDSLGDFSMMTEGLVDLVGTEFITGPCYKLADLHSVKEERIYMYGWHYYGTETLRVTSNETVPLNEQGITHGDDTIYIFAKRTLNSPDSEAAKRLVHVAANFIRKGLPTAQCVSGVPPWEEFKRGTAYYMQFGQDAVTLESEYREKFTVAREEHITGSSAIAISSPILLVISLIYLLFN